MTDDSHEPDRRHGLGRRHFLAGGAALTLGAAGARAGSAAAEPVRHGAGDTGVTIVPTDARYTDVTSGLNRRWVAHPRQVRLCRSTSDVRRAVQDAVSSGRRLTVRSGGHCYEDFVYNGQTQVIVDVSQLRGVEYDSRRRAFAVLPGTQLLELYEAMFKEWGVALPGGTTATVGVAGLVLGGGYGLLSRRDGLAADHLYAVEMVVVDAAGAAHVVVATREPDDPHRDLWWACTGGGGGSFGIVTKLWFRSSGARGADPAQLLPRPPADVLLSQLAIPWRSLSEDQFHRLIDNFGRWYTAHQTPGTSHGDAFSFLLLNHKSAGVVNVITQYDATDRHAADDLSTYLAALLDGVAGSEVVTPAARLPWLTATHLVATSGVVTNPLLRAEHKSAYLRRAVPRSQVAALYRHLTTDTFSNPNAVVALYSYGSRINDVRPAATASVQRHAVLKLLYQSFWTDPADDTANIEWLQRMYTDVYSETDGVPVPDGSTDGCYVNYPDIRLSDPKYNRSDVPWSGLYFQDNYPRLQRVKARWDPRDVFRHGQSIRLP